MIRLGAALAAFVLSSAAWGQVIYAPPPEVRTYNPYYDRLTPQGVARLRVLSECPGAAFLPWGGPFRQVTGLYDNWGNPIIAEYSPLDLGIDPQTGQPLYFRKADLLPPEPPSQAGENRTRETRAERSATTRPSAPGEYPPGTIIIKPYRPRGAASQGGR